jgi:hypothetical protein
VQPEGAEQTLYLLVGVDGPNTKMITMLVCDSRTFGVELDMDTVAVCLWSEEFTSDRDRGRVGVLGIVDALGLCQGTSRVFA